jgi:hypothetical protein
MLTIHLAFLVAKMERLEIQISELEKKIAVENKVKEGAVAMKAMLKDKNALTEVEVSISESEKRLEFLQRELQKLTLRKSGSEEILSQRTETSTNASTQITDPALPSKGGLIRSDESMGAKKISGASKSTDNVSREKLPLALNAAGKTGSGFFKLANFRSNNSSTTSIGSGPTPPDPLASNTLASSGRKPSFTNLDVSKTGMALTPEKVAIKLWEIQNKLDIETRVKAGAEKLSQVLETKSDLLAQDRKSKAEISKKLKDSTAKISLLKVALQRYQGLNVEGLADLTGKMRTMW